MFWKNVNFLRLKSLSLVTKLMTLYSLSTIGLLTAIGIFLYPTFNKIMENINGSAASYLTVDCYKKIIIASLLGSLCAILFGNIIARNGLRRIEKFEELIEQITANSLHERIDLREWPKELKNLANKFNNMLARIENSFIKLSRFSADIAHELRTPINNLRGITEIALSQKNHTDEFRKILEKYMDEYQHLSKLIENLLFLARSDNGQLVIKKEIFQVQEEILNICDYFQAIADENKIQLICVGNADLFADLTLFKRIFSNLISNSIKYTPPNGKISVYIETIEQWVKISIHDTGIGIDSEHIPHIFDRFYRIDFSRSAQSGGLGLGLAIVKAIVDLHNGQITIESKPGFGASVYLQLPSNF